MGFLNIEIGLMKINFHKLGFFLNKGAILHPSVKRYIFCLLLHIIILNLYLHNNMIFNSFDNLYYLKNLKVLKNLKEKKIGWFS